MKALNKRFTEK